MTSKQLRKTDVQVKKADKGKNYIKLIQGHIHEALENCEQEEKLLREISRKNSFEEMLLTYFGWYDKTQNFVLLCLVISLNDFSSFHIVGSP